MQNEKQALMLTAEELKRLGALGDVRVKIVRLLLRHESIFSDPAFNGALHLHFSVKENALKAVVDVNQSV